MADPGVGPVLVRGALARAIVLAITELNPGAVFVERGSYVRVRVPRRCVVTRSAIEAHLGTNFALPSDLERVMPSFAGILSFTEEGVEWRSAS